ncbi:MAG TPA: universal stress protein [Candidatus Angelobacter sp.]|nr:universal stress protein [Candidatus Angelobacter sp.]
MKTLECCTKTLECSTAISFKNILFLTDFTPASDAAFTHAVELARHFAARLFAAHAITPYLPTELDAPMMPDILNQMESEKRAQLIELVKNTGVSNTVLVTQRAVEDAVPRWINEHGIDLIVMGTHGRKGVDRLFLGSTAEAIVRTATCPVLTVGPGVVLQLHSELDIKRVLFATSLTKENDPAVAYALSFARERSANLTVLHALPDPAETQEDWKVLADIARDKMKELAPSDDVWPGNAEFIVEPGDASIRILEYAEDRRPGLIVLGLSEDTKPSTHFRKGVAYKVISSAPCAVLTVR